MFYPDTFQISPSDREIRITRDFDAPRQLVFDAFTKPELVRRWLLGPPGWTMPICEIDLSVGGAYRYVWRKEGVSDMGLGGVFQEIVSPERILVPGRRSGHHRIRRDRPRHQHDGYRTSRIAGSARHRPPVRHGARDGGRLQPTGGNAFVDARRWRAMKTPPESKSTNADEFMRQLQHPPHLEIEAVRHLIRDAQSVGQHLQDRADYRQGEGVHQSGCLQHAQSTGHWYSPHRRYH